jgi:hypothetical protein
MLVELIPDLVIFHICPFLMDQEKGRLAQVCTHLCVLVNDNQAWPDKSKNCIRKLMSLLNNYPTYFNNMNNYNYGNFLRQVGEGYNNTLENHIRDNIRNHMIDGHNIIIQNINENINENNSTNYVWDSLNLVNNATELDNMRLNIINVYDSLMTIPQDNNELGTIDHEFMVSLQAIPSNFCRSLIAVS